MKTTDILTAHKNKVIIDILKHRNKLSLKMCVCVYIYILLR